MNSEEIPMRDFIYFHKVFLEDPEIKFDLETESTEQSSSISEILSIEKRFRITISVALHGSDSSDLSFQ